MDARLKHLNALNTFVTSARLASYSMAAEELFVSQAAVSQQIRLLEQSLGVKLFIRSGRNMLLTQQGQELYHACSQGFKYIIDGLNKVKQDGIAGELTITSTQAFCSLWLMPRLYKFSLLHPDINIRILASNTLEDMAKKHIDVAIRFGLDKSRLQAEHLTIEQCGTIKAFPVCSPKLISSNNITTPKDLLNCQLIYLANQGKVTWQRWFEEAGVTGYEQHKMKTEVSSTDMALSAVLGGYGVTLAATELFSTYFASKQVVIPFNIQHPVQWYRFLLYDQHSSKLARINIFIDWLKNEIMNNPDKTN
ncbi:LysR substrate-binding domain-containing protein [Thalassotalea hakodatensis]|uniref:LysR substrate-binding domain-containing protein n=1 Tax=Thalassotalea hakodatensis TaxID=3030492 RepID=UPI002573E579|nr:LysR substrate-binding domain-containing protein [Thalassotalea hakodatensis]